MVKLERIISGGQTGADQAALDVAIELSIPHGGWVPAQLTCFKPNRVKLKAEIRRPSFLVLSEVYYPGWEARVDGKPAPLLKADYILRAVPLMPGEHWVELRFRPRPFIWGLAISALGLAGIACLFARPQFVLGSDYRDQAKAR